ncbi:MAG: hypothetical protein OER04_18975, partial [Cyclobacteriaceae bacterium]|nr:hypothetical protein [Cyclobacteriaceae bacterium]
MKLLYTMFSVPKINLIYRPTLISLILIGTHLIHAQPDFTKSFSPDVIGPGSTTTLTFLIQNQEGVPVTELDFADNLPTGISVSAPAALINTCGGIVTAADGGSSITLTDGVVGAFETCMISVNVTSSTVGIHSNTSDELTSSAGNSGSATDDLTVTADRPGFTKSFSPEAVDLGEVSTLTFTVDNSANTSPVTFLSFTDNLPQGMQIADPPNASTDCFNPAIPPTTFNAVAGTDVITLSALGIVSVPVIAAGSTCTVTVDVLATGVGSLGNISEDLNIMVGGSTLLAGKASAVLEVTRSDLHIQKTFIGDPLSPGATGNLEFTLTNFDRNFSATNISFSDDLDAALMGLVATGLPLTDVCGMGSSLTGTSTLTLSGGNLAAGASCTFLVPILVPTDATHGSYRNNTSTISGLVDGSQVNGNSASANLFVAAVPILTKTFTNDPVVPGTSVILEFSITNTSTNQSLTDIAFTDELTSFLGFPVSATLPPAGMCNGSGSLSIASCGTDCQALSFTAGTLAAGASCTFSVTIDIP